MKWTEEEHNYLIDLVKQHGTNWALVTQLMSEKFMKSFSRERVRAYYGRNKEKIISNESEKPIKYKETNEILADGSHKSDKLLRMSDEQSKDVNYLLEAHGFDIESWELVSARNNIWNVYSKEDKIQTLYSSKITVKPKEYEFDWDLFVEQIKDVPKVFIKPKYIPAKELYLNTPLFDMHFGVSDYEYYKPTQAKILNLLKNNYKEVLVIIGQDLLHNDDFRGRTSSGTPIEQVNMVSAWKDAALFYEPIIKEALEKSGHVKVMYSKGNHDESMSWAFVQYLTARFPDATFDDQFRERKVHMLGNNFCGVNHGDKKKEVNLTENFSVEFPMEWSRAKTRTIYTGHLHSERVIDKGGVLIRRMPTRNKIDQYHDDHGYTMAHKRFEVFEYSVDELETIHYV